MKRRVVLICGPPGAGKTTYADTLGLNVYDSDDEEWLTERQFTAALKRLGFDPAAQAAVIRAGATKTARARAASLCRPTETIILAVAAEICIDRIKQRGRSTIRHEIAGVASWWNSYEADTAHDIGQPSRNW